MGGLDGGADGLDVLRRVTAAAPVWLAPAVETFVRNGLIPRVATSDELDATVVIGTRPALQSGPGG